MNLSQWDVTQVDEVWLVLCRHAKQLEAVKELWKHAIRWDVGDRTDEMIIDRELEIKWHFTIGSRCVAQNVFHQFGIVTVRHINTMIH